MAVAMIVIDPYKASHTAVAINAAQEPLGELRVRACAAQAERLLAWPTRTDLDTGQVPDIGDPASR